MFCPNCGVQNENGANYCSQCGKPLNQSGAVSNIGLETPVQTEDVETYITGSIIVTVCCCLPFGIPAIVYSALAISKNASGDIEGAKKMAANARMWCLIAFFTGGALLIPTLIRAFYQIP